MRCIILILIFLSVSWKITAQQLPLHEELAAKLALRMRDSLQLTTTVQQQLYETNMQLHYRKMSMWQQFKNSPDTLTRMIQRVENSRDSLYKRIIGEEKFGIYIIRKKTIINNN